MALTIAEFRERMPVFASTVAYPDAFVDLRLQEAARRMSVAWFGNRFDDAHQYLTAHLITLNPAAASGSGGGAGGASGPVSSVTAGRVSLTYASPFTSSASWTTASNSALASTIYGRQYLELVNLVGGARTLAPDSVGQCLGIL